MAKRTNKKKRSQRRKTRRLRESSVGNKVPLQEPNNYEMRDYKAVETTLLSPNTLVPLKGGGPFYSHIKHVASKKQDLPHNVKMLLGLSRTEPQNIQTCINKLGNNIKIINLCNVLNGQLIKQPDMNREKTEKFMDLWYHYPFLTEEILKTIKSKEICFLHPIILVKNNEWSPRIYADGKYYHLSIKKYLIYEFLKCVPYAGWAENKVPIEPNQKTYTLAVPIYLYDRNLPYTHANMVIITINTDNGRFENIVIEHFEPNGYSNGEFSSEQISTSIKKLFIEMITLLNISVTVDFILPKQECMSIQEYFRNSKYEGSCQFVSMIYALHRVIYPELTQAEIYNNITEIFENKQRNGVLEEYINDVIYSLISLLDIDLNNIDYDNFIINPAGKTKKVITFDEEQRSLISKDMKN